MPFSEIYFMDRLSQSKYKFMMKITDLSSICKKNQWRIKKPKIKMRGIC